MMTKNKPKSPFTDLFTETKAARDQMRKKQVLKNEEKKLKYLHQIVKETQDKIFCLKSEIKEYENEQS